MRRGLVIAAGWVGGVVAAAAFGITTVSALGAGPGPGGPLSRQEVDDRLARGSIEPTPVPAGSTPAPSPTTARAADPARQYFTTSGGGLWASCSGGLATVETMTPRPGYRLDDYDKGPRPEVWVRFKQDVDHGHANEYRVSVTCVDGVPRVTERSDD